MTLDEALRYGPYARRLYPGAFSEVPFGNPWIVCDYWMFRQIGFSTQCFSLMSPDMGRYIKQLSMMEMEMYVLGGTAPFAVGFNDWEPYINGVTPIMSGAFNINGVTFVDPNFEPVSYVLDLRRRRRLRVPMNLAGIEDWK
jgi:hypothetical protein